MKQRLFGAAAVVAPASFAAATPGIAKSAPALQLAMDPTSAPPPCFFIMSVELRYRMKGLARRLDADSEA